MRRIKEHTLAMGQTMSIHAMNMTTEISEAVGILQSELQAHPECDGGLAAQAALKGETLVIEDVAADKRVLLKKELAAEGLASMIVAPITVKDKVIGTLRLYSAFTRKYPQDVVIMVQALAHQGGLAIQNASMYLKLQSAQKELEADVWSHRSWF